MPVSVCDSSRCVMSHAYSLFDSETLTPSPWGVESSWETLFSFLSFGALSHVQLLIKNRLYRIFGSAEYSAENEQKSFFQNISKKYSFIFSSIIHTLSLFMCDLTSLFTISTDWIFFLNLLNHHCGVDHNNNNNNKNIILIYLKIIFIIIIIIIAVSQTRTHISLYLLQKLQQIKCKWDSERALNTCK